MTDITDIVIEYYDEADDDNNNYRQEFIERKNPGLFNSIKSLCPPGETVQLPYPPDCKRFINCWKGRSSIQVSKRSFDTAQSMSTYKRCLDVPLDDCLNSN